MTTTYFEKYALFLTVMASIFTSCSQANDPMADSLPGTVTMNISGAVFETESQSNARHATPYLATDDYDMVQRSVTEIGNDLLMIAEFSADDPSEMTNQKSIKDATRAATTQDTSAVTPGMRYRVLVFNATTQVYVTQRDYTRGSELNTATLLLDGGTTYTFVVYSLNTTAALPALTVSAGTTLNNLSITVAGNQDFMYFKQNLTVSGGSGVSNRLDIVLKHRFSQITTVINSSNTGYNITAVTSNFKPHATTTNVALATGNFTGTASTTGSPVTFTTPNAQTVTSTPTIVANTSGSTAGSYTITSMRIGNLTQTTSMIPFPDLVIQPGVRYTLRLTITTDDADLGTYNDQPAVRINGVIWAKQNVGATSTDPNVVSRSSYGNYYQYGRSTIVGTEATTSLNSSSYITFAAEPAARSWNLGSEAAPVKTTADPCPAGYRVPTQTEFRSLLNGVSQVPFGTFATNTNYNNYVQLTSLRKAGVTLNLPAIGHLSLSYSTGASGYNRTNRGNPTTMRYHTSSSQSRGDTPYSYVAINNATSRNATVNNTSNRSSKYMGGHIRCVGIPNP